MSKKYNIDKSKLVLANNRNIHDDKLSTKPVGYFKDAMRRFARNKASVVAAIILALLFLYAIVGPFLINANYAEAYDSDKMVMSYKNLLPKLSFMEGTGIWDGTRSESVGQSTYYTYVGIGQETGRDVVVKLKDVRDIGDDISGHTIVYDVVVDRYSALGVTELTFTEQQYLELQQWQEDNGVQLFYPRVSYNEDWKQKNSNVWYVTDEKGKAILDSEGQLQQSYIVDANDTDNYSGTRIEGDPGNWSYATIASSASGSSQNYIVRVSLYNYFVQRYGFEPSFAFGTTEKGYDIFSRLASGARFSFILAIVVSLINLTIGAVYGAIEGYYGGLLDMGMERFSDILNGVPFMVVTVLFQLHLASKVGVVGALLYAFVLTGWISMAASTRMQFYRYKNQEYVLAARTLGASDRRIMFKHIFPNALGTLITSCVLVIPGVIFSETSLSYLGIINLDSPTMSSVGSMLNSGRGSMTTYPHIIVFPALFIGLLMVAFNLFGNGLRDAFNPSLRGTEG